MGDVILSCQGCLKPWCKFQAFQLASGRHLQKSEVQPSRASVHPSDQPFSLSRLSIRSNINTAGKARGNRPARARPNTARITARSRSDSSTDPVPPAVPFRHHVALSGNRAFHVYMLNLEVCYTCRHCIYGNMSMWGKEHVWLAVLPRRHLGIPLG